MNRRLILCCSLLLAGCPSRDPSVLSVTGQIEGTTVSPGSRIGGRIAEVLVEEGASVEAGAVLVRLETRESEAVLAASRARVAQAEALVAKLEAGARPEEIRRAKASVDQADANYLMALKGARVQEIEASRAGAEANRALRDEALAEYNRLKKLQEGNAVSEQVADQAKHQLEAAENQYRASMQQLDQLLEGTRDEQIAAAGALREQAVAAFDELQAGTRKEDLAAARAARDAANADVQHALVVLEEMTVTAPRAGIVEELSVEPGDIVRPGPLVTLADPEDLELAVFVSAKVLGLLKLGQAVPITTDSHGDEEFSATVTQIASQGEFTPRNLQTEEERVQQVFGIKLALDSYGGKLRAGMSATAHMNLLSR